ncbi:MAG: hypothetical protein FJZ92_07165 [Chloroflexi bacterium]|nr:hypothetical protein [Chloroflexota bacterium]
MRALDAPDLYERLDPANIRARIADLPRQAREAWSQGCEWPLPAELQRRPARVLLLGVGGSAIGADVVASLATDDSTVPVQLIRNYAAPPTDGRSLVVACSFSGETEETLLAFQAELHTPGPRLAVTTGGTLAEVAERAGVPVFRYTWDGPPRSALGYGVFALLAILSRAGVLGADPSVVDATIRGLEADAKALGVDTPYERNPAKQLAHWLHGGVPVVIGADILEVAARRWAGQIAENAKQWALPAALPEIDHNLIVGFGAPAHALPSLRALILDGAAVHPRNRLRATLTLEALVGAGVPGRAVEVPGASTLEAATRGCYLGDWTSLYLAILNDADPAPAEPIDRLKDALSRRAER